jgi:very-short-patch-repair endonuclease
MHKRTTPKIFARAKRLHRNMSPAEAKLWQHLRAHRMGDVHYRNQHAIGNYIVDFCAPRKKLVISWMAVITWSSRNTMRKERNTWKHTAIEFCGFGTMKY